MSWNAAGGYLTSGSKDCKIISHDLRQPNSNVVVYQGHTQEVCGLKWNPEGTQLASGANDNNVFVWDPRLEICKYQFSEHKAAVKALSWCPWQRSLLVSGGGTSDQTMKFWHTDTGLL